MAEIRGQQRGKEVKYQLENGEIITAVTMRYTVYDSSGTLGRHAIMQTSGLPLLREAVTVDDIPSIMTCKGKDATQDKSNLKYWTVTVELDNRPETQNRTTDENAADSPTQWVQIASLEYDQVEEVADVDTYGIDITNLARRPYSSPVVLRRLIVTIPFIQYEPITRPLDDIIEWNGALNESTFLGKDKGMWQLTIEDADLGVIRGETCWKIVGKLRYKKRKLSDTTRFLRISNPATREVSAFTETEIGGWQPLVPQLDYVAVDGTPITDGKGNQIRGKLNNQGQALSDQSEHPYYFYHEVFPYLDFNSIIRITTQP